MKNVVQMNFGLLVAVLFSLVFFNSCTEENKFPYGVESPPVLSFDGFVYVNANGQKTSLGINQVPRQKKVNIRNILHTKRLKSERTYPGA